MKPRKPLPKSTTPIRRSRLPASTRPPRARKADPKKRRFAKHRDPAYQEWIRARLCVICGIYGVDPAHVVPRSLGSSDMYNLVPLCRRHHDEQEGQTVAFERKYGVNLKDIAREHTERFLAEFPEHRPAGGP